MRSVLGDRRRVPALVVAFLGPFCLLGLWGAVASPIAMADEVSERGGDYGPSEERWNHMGYLGVTAREARVTLRREERLDLSTLEAQQVVLWVYPQYPFASGAGSKGDAAQGMEGLLRWVSDGGRLIIADDFGTSGPLLERLGLRLLPRGPSRHTHWYSQLDGLARLDIAGDSFLSYNVDHVVTNYPAVLQITGGDPLGPTSSQQIRPLVSFDGGGEYAVVEVSVGRGAVVALSDPSVLTNEMVRRFYGNKQFAANLMRQGCPPDACEVILLGPASDLVGSYTAQQSALGALPRLFRSAAGAIDAAGHALNDGLSAAPVATALPLLVALALALLVAVSLAPLRVPPRTPALEGAEGVPSPAAHDALGLGARQHDADFASFALTLVAHLEQLSRGAGGFAGLAGDDPEATPDGRLRAPHRVPPEAMIRSAILRLSRDADSLRSPRPPVISSERFYRIYGDAQLIERFIHDGDHGRHHSHRHSHELPG